MSFALPNNVCSPCDSSGGCTACNPSTGACTSATTKVRCLGFEPPMDKTVVVTKPNRVLPLKMVCTDAVGTTLTNLEIVPPVVEVDCNSTNFIPDAVEEALFSGVGDEGNMFEYSGGYWQFNLQTKNFTAIGTYTIRPVSGDTTNYEISTYPTAIFEVRVKK